MKSPELHLHLLSPLPYVGGIINTQIDLTVSSLLKVNKFKPTSVELLRNQNFFLGNSPWRPEEPLAHLLTFAYYM